MTKYSFKYILCFVFWTHYSSVSGTISIFKIQTMTIFESSALQNEHVEASGVPIRVPQVATKLVLQNLSQQFDFCRFYQETETKSTICFHGLTIGNE